MSYPRVERIITEHIDEFVLNFYTGNQSIEFDRDRCTGCSVCVKVCPKGVIVQKHHGKIRVKTVDLFPEITDATLCAYCGTCVYMCPFSAITLKKNGKPVALNDIPIVKEKVVPKLEFTRLKCKSNNKYAKIYVEGKVIIDWNRCISCMSCYEVCPNRAFFKTEKKNKLGKTVKLDINVRAACLYCHACEVACSQNAIKVKVDKINFSGDFKEPFWTDLLRRSQS